MDISKTEQELATFVAKNLAAGRRIAIVTSGGTQAPLEKRTVRYLENFSTGARGATCAERLLDNDYAVIFLHREGSRRPFLRVVSHAVDAFIESCTQYLSAVARKEKLPGAESEERTAAAETQAAEVVCTVSGGLRALATQRLLEVRYTTVEEYLAKLKAASKAVEPAGEKGLVVLAAAVSDFFVPPAQREEHKIQSDAAVARGGGDGGALDSVLDSLRSVRVAIAQAIAPTGTLVAVPPGGLAIPLSPVPKALHLLKESWAPRAFVVSYKLETDPALLLPKAAQALVNAGVDMVVANGLTTRHKEVALVARDDRPPVKPADAAPAAAAGSTGAGEGGADSAAPAAPAPAAAAAPARPAAFVVPPVGDADFPVIKGLRGATLHQQLRRVDLPAGGALPVNIVRVVAPTPEEEAAAEAAQTAAAMSLMQALTTLNDLENELSGRPVDKINLRDLWGGASAKKEEEKRKEEQRRKGGKARTPEEEEVAKNAEEARKARLEALKREMGRATPTTPAHPLEDTLTSCLVQAHSIYLRKAAKKAHDKPEAAPAAAEMH